MKADKIKELETIEKHRSGSNGFLTGNLSLSTTTKTELIVNGQYITWGINEYFKKAVIEKFDEILIRALELEEQNYQIVKNDAKIEASAILHDLKL